MWGGVVRWRCGGSPMLVAALLVFVGAAQCADILVTEPGTDTVLPMDTARGQSIRRDFSSSGTPTRYTRDATWSEDDDPRDILWHDMELAKQKGHLGAAMNMMKPSWSQQDNLPLYYRLTRFQTDPNDVEFSNEDSGLDKRHLGSALRMRFGGLARISEPVKRHLGAALRFRQPRQPRFDEWRRMYRSGWNGTPTTYKDYRDSILGSLYRTYTHGRRYRSNLRAKRDVENIGEQIIGEDGMLDQNLVKRHIGAALYPGHQPWYNQVQQGQSYHIGNKRYGNAENDESDNFDNEWMIQNGGDAAEDRELYQRFLQKRHFGSALNLAQGEPKWKSDGYQKPYNEKKNTDNGEENEVLSNSEIEQVVDGLEGSEYKRHLGSAMKFKPRITNVDRDKKDDDEDQNKDTEGLVSDEERVDERHLGVALGFTSSNKENKRHIGSQLYAGKWEYNDEDGTDDVKRHLGSARQWAQNVGKRHFGAARNAGNGKAWVHQGKRYTGSERNLIGQLNAVQEESVKRHIGSILSAGKREDDDEEGFEKRHLGSVMKWAVSPNRYRHLGEVRNHGKGRYWVKQGKRENENQQIDAAMMSGRMDIDEDVIDKRHMGAMMSARKREVEDVDKKHLGVVMSMGKRHMGAAMSAGKREVNDDDDDENVDKRHLGAAMSMGKRHMGAAMSAGKREVNDDNDDNVDKRHLGAAMLMDKRHIGAAMSAGKREVNDGDDNVDKRHLGAAMSMGKRHMGAAMSAGKREANDDNDDNDAVKRHLGAAMSIGKRHMGATISEGKGEIYDDVDKRHMGVAMSAGKRHIGAAMSAGKREIEEDDAAKKHIGSVMATGKREIYEDGLHSLNEDKRHFGSAMKFRNLKDFDEKRHMGSAMKFRNFQNLEEKRHLGSAMKFRNFQNQQEKRHLGAAMKFRKFQNAEEKRHLGSAMKFRNFQSAEEKRHLGSAMKYKNFQSEEEKRHLGSAMKFRNFQLAEEKRHLGSAMKFRNFQRAEEKRHLGSAISFGHWTSEEPSKPYQEFKRFGSSMNFDRWGSSNGQRLFGGPFNVRRLNPTMGEKEEEEKRSNLNPIEMEIDENIN